MDNNALARRLIALGKREHALLAKLGEVAAERCALLREVACNPSAGLDGDIATLATAPKDDDPGDGNGGG